MSNHHEVTVTILEHPGVRLDAVITIDMNLRNNFPTMETTLSLPAEEHVAAFCSQLTYRYGVTFVEEGTGTMHELYYIGQRGNYYQFFSHPD